jgi:hypothetical protein
MLKNFDLPSLLRRVILVEIALVGHQPTNRMTPKRILQIITD